MSAESIAASIIMVVQGYLLLGLVFAILFALVLAGRLDPSARGSSWGFRLLVIPGVALLWPLILSRVLRGRQTPVECNAHRACAARRYGDGDATRQRR